MYMKKKTESQFTMPDSLSIIHLLVVLNICLAMLARNISWTNQLFTRRWNESSIDKVIFRVRYVWNYKYILFYSYPENISSFFSYWASNCLFFFDGDIFISCPEKINTQHMLRQFTHLEYVCLIHAMESNNRFAEGSGCKNWIQ